MKILYLGPPSPIYNQLVAMYGLLNVRIREGHMRGIIDPQADIIVSYRYRYKVPRVVLDHVNEAINIHAGVLPFCVGAHPIFWAIHDGSPVGVTIHRMTAEIDAGPIFTYGKVTPRSQETFATLYDRVENFALSMFCEWWDKIAAAKVEPKVQTAFRATFHKTSDLPQELLPLGWHTPIAHVKAVVKGRSCG